MYDDVTLDAQWFQDSLSLTLIKYFPRKRTAPEIPLSTHLVWQFKNNNTLAIRKVRDLAIEALNIYEELAEFRPGCLVAIPPHTAGSINMPCETLCAELARAFPSQLVHHKQALRRVINVEQSSAVPASQRPTYIDHMGSIAYYGPKIDPRTRIIMVDDVLTRRETSNACRDILKRATNCKNVRGLFVAKTMSYS